MKNVIMWRNNWKFLRTKVKKMEQKQTKKHANMTPAERQDLSYKLRGVRSFFAGQEMRYGYPDVKVRLKARREMIEELFGKVKE